MSANSSGSRSRSDVHLSPFWSPSISMDPVVQILTLVALLVLWWATARSRAASGFSPMVVTYRNSGAPLSDGVTTNYKIVVL
jgi:hypothetical protein